jgi:CPA2 family monovalent cation:H+ antiporter-2
MEHTTYSLIPVISILISGIAGAAIMKFLRITPILGYFIAGIIIGPSLLGLVEEGEVILLLAEIGVVLLLFDIGLHLSFPQMWRLRYDLFVMGPLQVGSAAVVIGFIANLFGFSWETSLIIGLGLSLSSTAIVMQLISEKKQSNNPLGQTSMAILVFQDLLMVFLLVLVPALGGESETSLQLSMSIALLKTIGVFIIVYVVGKYCLQPILVKIIKHAEEELFTAAILLVIIATATFTGYAGLSLPLGAFLAGLIIAETNFCYMVKAEIKPFRGLLLGLFFITVGITLNFTFLLDNIGKIIIFVVALMAFKIVTLALVALFRKRSILASVQLGLWLSQAGEFGFVLFGLAFKQNLLDNNTYQILMSVIGISFLLTPLMIFISDKLGRSKNSNQIQAYSARGKVIIFGFGAEGKNVARLLHGADIDYLGVDNDYMRVATAKSQGFDVTLGDPSKMNIYKSINVGEASAMVFALDNDASLSRYVKRVQSKYPDLKIFANVLEEKSLKLLANCGDLKSCFDKHQNGVGVSRFLLELLGKDPSEIEILIKARVSQYS